MHDRIPDLLNLQCLLLAIAVALTSTAAYGALRLETISQTSTVAEIGDTLQVTGQNDLLAISVSALPSCPPANGWASTWPRSQPPGTWPCCASSPR